MVWKRFKKAVDQRLRPLLLSGCEPLLRLYYTRGTSLRHDLRTFFHYDVLGKKAVLSHPSLKELVIVPSTVCNGRCVFCAYRKMAELGSIMPMNIFRKAVDDFKAMGGKRVSLCPTVGEDLVDPGIFDKIAYAKQQGMFVYTFTNGILLLQNSNYQKLVDSSIDELFISTGDVVPEREAAIFGIPVDVAKRKLDGVLALLDCVRDSGKKIPVIIGFRSERPFRKLWADLKKTRFFEHYNAGRFSIGYVLGYDNWAGRISQADLRGVMHLRRMVKHRKYPCGKMFLVSVLPDGSVRLCGCRIKDSLKDELVIGNIMDAPLPQVLANGRIEQLAQRCIANDWPEVCRECSFYYPDVPKKR